MAFDSPLTKSHLAQLPMGSISTTDCKILPRLTDRSPSHVYIIKTRQAANTAEAPAVFKGTCGCLTALTASYSFATAYCTTRDRPTSVGVTQIHVFYIPAIFSPTCAVMPAKMWKSEQSLYLSTSVPSSLLSCFSSLSDGAVEMSRPFTIVPTG